VLPSYEGPEPRLHHRMLVCNPASGYFRSLIDWLHSSRLATRMAIAVTLPTCPTVAKQF
jgi:hypothetical protein